ncbi:MAG: thiol:disulfide interchange protein DsbA/DsbL [Stenotrophomonas sp.]
MKIRLALVLTALLPLMAACTPQDGSADATAAATPAAATAETAPASDTAAATDEGAVPAAEQTAEAPAATADDNVPVPAQARLVGPEPVAGTDYVAIEGGQPIQPASGKIEVAEVFSYVCPACARFQPLVASWKAGLPSDVNFVYVPAMFGSYWDDYSRAYYAAEALGVQEKTHDALYAAIHIERTLNGELGSHDSPQDIANFYGKHGVDARTFLDTMGSFSVVAKANRAKQFIQRSKITGTPSLIVNGKYLVKGRSYEDMLRIADHLIARERASNAR